MVNTKIISSHICNKSKFGTNMNYFLSEVNNIDLNIVLFHPLTTTLVGAYFKARENGPWLKGQLGCGKPAVCGLTGEGGKAFIHNLTKTFMHFLRQIML